MREMAEVMWVEFYEPMARAINNAIALACQHPWLTAAAFAASISIGAVWDRIEAKRLAR